MRPWPQNQTQTQSDTPTLTRPQTPDTDRDTHINTHTCTHLRATGGAWPPTHEGCGPSLDPLPWEPDRGSAPGAAPLPVAACWSVGPLKRSGGGYTYTHA